MRKAVEQPGLGIGRKNDRRLTDLDFADDLVLVAEDGHVCQGTSTNLAEHSAQFGLHVSQEKTKIIRTNQTSEVQPILIEQAELQRVDHFTYLGSVISNDEDVEKVVITQQLSLEDLTVRNGSLGMSTKVQLRVYAAVVVSTAILYASETWKAQEGYRRSWTYSIKGTKSTKDHRSYLEGQGITNAEVLKRTGQSDYRREEIPVGGTHHHKIKQNTT